MMRRIFRQDGVALPAAMGVMLVISLFVGAFFALSLRTSDTANADRNSKRALAAAEAGLQAAVYRMNSIRPTVPTMCLTTVPVPVDATGQCPHYEEDLGNGASYRYWVTPELGANAANCVTLTGYVPEVPSSDRCITSMGTVNGVSRRVQLRIVKQRAGFSFSQVGLVGTNLFYAWNSVKMWTDVGSNGQLELINSIEVNNSSSPSVSGVLKLPADAPPEIKLNSVNVAANPDRQDVAPWTLDPVDFEPVDGDVAGENNNSVLIGRRSSTGDFVYDPGTNSLDISSGTYVIPPGTYHFCRVYLGNSVELRRPDAGGPTKIYVDGRQDEVPRSPCNGSEDGRFLVNNSVKFNQNTTQGDLTEVYLHGTSRDADDTPGVDTSPPDWDRPSWCEVQNGSNLGADDLWAQCRSDFVFGNSVEFYGTVYAPNSTIEARNSTKIWGGMAAQAIRFYNSVEFHVTAGARARATSTAGPAIRKGWTECRSQPTVAGDPESGC